MPGVDLFFTLLGLHFLADYPLQGAYLSAMKNPASADAIWLGRRAWVQGLLAHSAIHGLFVGLATGSLVLGLAEAALHGLIDYTKMKRRIGAVTDQLLHIICKAAWVFLVVERLHTQSPLLR